MSIENMRYPFVLYYLMDNPDFGREYTVDDTDDLDKELFDDYKFDLKPRTTNYNEYNSYIKERELAQLKRKSECEFSVHKLHINSRSELHNTFLEFKDKNYKICDNKFGIKKMFEQYIKETELNV